MGKLRRAIGLMSGTSMDGIDVALLETDGEAQVRRLAGGSYGYDPDFRGVLQRAVAEAAIAAHGQARPGALAEAERQLTARHGEAVARFLETNGLLADGIDVIGFHGQSVLHRPAQQLSIQLGDGNALARQSGIDVVYDLRAADLALGGQGAPLVPVYHRALAARLPQRPLAFLNIGGVANITYVRADGGLIAFDCGPGNALIDDWAMRHSGKPIDQDGALAGMGSIDEDALIALMTHGYFGALPPKSLDRNAFSPDPVSKLSPADGAATLTAFTAEAVARAAAHLPQPPALWVVCGGGRRNRTLMSMIAERAQNAVVPAEAVHLDGDAMEAEAFAYLAVRSLEGLPITFPMTTGVPAPMTGGVLARA